MSLGNSAETAVLALILQAVTWTSVAQNASSDPYANTYFGLHTSTGPGEGGNQTTNEAAYTGYEREAVARTTGGWDVTDNVASPDADVEFAPGAGGGETVTTFSIGWAATSTGVLLLHGTVTPNITTGSGVTPSLTTGTEITID